VKTPLTALFLSQNTSVQIENIAYTIALTQGITVISGLLGGIAGSNFLKKVDIKVILSLSFLGQFAFLLGIIINHFWFGFAVMMLGVFAAGAFNVQFTAFIINETPAEKLGTVSASMDAYFSAIPAIIGSGLIALASFSLNVYAVIGIVISIASVIFILKIRREDITISKNVQIDE
jgi:hypothetical protein